MLPHDEENERKRDGVWEREITRFIALGGTTMLMGLASATSFATQVINVLLSTYQVLILAAFVMLVVQVLVCATCLLVRRNTLRRQHQQQQALPTPKIVIEAASTTSRPPRRKTPSRACKKRE